MSSTQTPPRRITGNLAARAQQLAGATAERMQRVTHPTRPTDPAAALFRRIGWQLALRYAAVFAGLLLIAGVLLFVFFNNLLIGPIDPALKGSAQSLQQAWQQYPDRVPCGRLQAGAPYVVCYDSSGDILGGSFSVPAQVPDVHAFVDPGLFRRAIASPSDSVCDTVDGGNSLGAIRRCAVAVADPASGTIFGVAQVGLPIQSYLTALHLLVRLLLVLGVLALIGAVLGGVALSRRALAPARLALQRQQAFIGDAAHELRTPLTLARANAELLLHSRDRLDPEDAELLEDIVAEIGHMSALATSMLQLARLDEGGSASRPEREVIDLGELASGLARRAESLATERGLTLSVQAEPGVLVLGDRTQIEEVALILLDNAFKYNRPGGSVALAVLREGARALLSVADSGPGIEAEHLARLGERFYRVDKSRSRELGGAGLGLSIARRIAAAHGGSLAFTSEPGKGTNVALMLPAAE